MKIVNGDLQELKGLSYATVKNNILSSAIIPIHFNGDIETGEFEKQAELTFSNMVHILESAGGKITDVTQVIVYLKNLQHKDKMNEAWGKYFAEHFPNRATFIISDFAVPGIEIEIVVTAIINE